MDLGLKGKVALVTGGGSQKGFGKGIVLVLARQGCDIIAADIDLEGAKQTATEAEALGCKAIALKVDITKRNEVKDMVKAGLEKFGRIDILVNNAGVGTGMRSFVDYTEADWDLEVNVNLRGTLYCTHAILPHMIERKSGKIINIIAPAAPDGIPNATVYGATKAAVLSFSKGVAKEVGPLGINVNIIGPGEGDTGFYSKDSPEVQKRIKEMAAAGKSTTPEEVGNTVAYLASDFTKKFYGQFVTVAPPPPSQIPSEWLKSEWFKTQSK
jgi:3-oxoacyl-[acyl-carrier protein] reductase